MNMDQWEGWFTVEWWQILIALLEAYLLGSLLPWIGLQAVEWGLQRSIYPRAQQNERLRKLGEAKRQHQDEWPLAPRPGRYGEVDRLAREELAVLEASLAKATRLWPPLVSHAPPRLRLLEVLSFRAWPPFVKACSLANDARRFRALVVQGERAAAALGEHRQSVAAIPDRVRALLSDTRAELMRLQAAAEAEIEAGTVGLDDVLRRLQTDQAEVEKALDSLAGDEARSAEVVARADQTLDVIAAACHDIDQHLSQTAEERNKARDAVERIQSSVGLTAERWEGLKARGVKDAGLAQSLNQLRVQAQALGDLAGRRTLVAYRRINEDMGQFNAHLAEIMSTLDRIDELMTRSREATKGDVLLLAEAQQMCEALVKQDPLIDPDISLQLIEKAAQTFAEAEQQHDLGTIQGFEAALELSEAARKQLTQAQEALQAMPERIATVRDLLGSVASEALGDWRSRANRAREQLQLYARHWERGLAASAAEAIALIEQAEVSLERAPAGVRYQRRFRQSELGEAIDILSHAHDCTDKARALIEALESELCRIETMRQEVYRVAQAIETETFPSLQQVRERMLPELQQNLDQLSTQWDELIELLKDPGQVQYDEVATRHLPAIQHELEVLIAEQQKSEQHYRKLLADTVGRLDRLWSRLGKLDPGRPPRPEEDTDRLLTEYEDWRMEVERAAESPPLLRELLGRPAAALEARMETAYRQTVEGRRALDALQREYANHAQTARDLRAAIRDLRKSSPWLNLDWDTDEADRAWEEAIRQERNAHVAHTFVQALDELNKGVDAAERAEQLYARVQRQMVSALRHLGDALRVLNRGIERRQRQAAQLRERGDAEAAARLEAECVHAEQAAELAQGARSFEDALRYLRDASNALGVG